MVWGENPLLPGHSLNTRCCHSLGGGAAAAGRRRGPDPGGAARQGDPPVGRPDGEPARLCHDDIYKRTVLKKSSV